MYAVLKQGGKQYTVTKGVVLKLERVEGEIGDKIDFNDILLVNDGKNIQIGEPFLKNVPVVGEIVSQTRGKKISVIKKKRRKGYRRIKGHRQYHTDIKIISIGGN